MRFCKICGADDKHIEFYKNYNKCRDCALDILSAYNKRRAKDPTFVEERRKRWRKWYRKNRGTIVRNTKMDSKSKQSSPRRFLTDQMSHLRRISEKSDLSLDFLDDLWEKQNGRCAISGVEMTYKRGDLFAVRIDLKCGENYISPNVQLVCDGIKRMKKGHTNEEVKKFIAELKSVFIV